MFERGRLPELDLPSFDGDGLSGTTGTSAVGPQLTGADEKGPETESAPFVLNSVLPVVPARLVKRILKGTWRSYFRTTWRLRGGELGQSWRRGRAEPLRQVGGKSLTSRAECSALHCTPPLCRVDTPVKGGTCGPTWGSLPQSIVGWEAAGGASTMRPFVSSLPPWRQPTSVRLILPSSRPPSSHTDGVCRAARAVCPLDKTMKSAAEGDHRGRRMLAEATRNRPGGLSKATRGGGREPAMPGTMAGTTPQAVGSSMCALDATGTTRGRCAAVGSLPERVAADKQDMAATEASLDCGGSFLWCAGCDLFV